MRRKEDDCKLETSEDTQLRCVSKQCQTSVVKSARDSRIIDTELGPVLVTVTFESSKAGVMKDDVTAKDAKARFRGSQLQHFLQCSLFYCFYLLVLIVRLRTVVLLVNSSIESCNPRPCERKCMMVA
jgi:hypothetical protein